MSGKPGKKAPQKPPATPLAGDASPDDDADAPLTIVGIGASAGGLEAYGQFFRALPSSDGLAFVLVQHLDPDHVSVLPEILQRCTALPVIEAQDGMPVVEGHVYVSPPGRDLAIRHGVLHLSVPATPRGLRLPIDGFLRSLAEDQGEWAIGIILSGSGTDGTLGLRAILGAGGVTLVQTPATAKHDGMPSSAIDGGYATHVLPVEKMPAVIVGGARGRRQGRAVRSRPPVGMTRLLMFLRAATGHDFSLYKKSTIGRRIERRMRQNDIGDIDAYTDFLREHPQEVQALFKELLINVTSFFRDPEAFAVLRSDILPQLVSGKPDGYVFRVWVAGCASGEEAYSIAMLLREGMDEQRREFKVQIYGTDLDDEAIATARAGFYPPNIAADLTPERLHRYFTREENGYRVKKNVREMVVFATQNVIKDPPFTRLDLLSCRNLMIYLEPELQRRLIPVFHYALKPGGVLFLSPSESIGNHPELFSALNRKWKFYQANPNATSSRAVMTGGLSWVAESDGTRSAGSATKATETNFGEITRRALLESYAPASVLVDGKGNILFVHGETGKYLRPAPGQPTLNLLDMAREGLQVELRAALQVAANQGMPTLGREIQVRTNGDFQPVRLSVRPLANPEADGLMLVTFQDVAVPPPAKPARGGKAAAGSASLRRVDELERDLAFTRENLQSTIEEQQASNEELKSANEELQSTNEELQSTNEELETSKEELQSLNEELITVNAELQAKIEQLNGMQNDMKNLLDNVSAGIVFLDDDLRIRRFTREATRVYRLVPTDLGRPLADIKADIDGGDLLGEARTVLDTLVPCEREVQTVDGAWYTARLQPYRTMDNVIDGVVLTFSDISRRIAAEMQTARRLAERIVDTVREPLLILDGEMKVVSASRSYYRRFHAGPEETVGRRLFDLGHRQWDIPALRDALETVLPRDQAFDGFAVDVDLPGRGRSRMLLNARRVVGEGDGGNPMILLAMEEDAAG